METSAAIFRGAIQYPRTHRPWKNETLPPRSCEVWMFNFVGCTTLPRNTCLGLYSHGQSTQGADGNDTGEYAERLRWRGLKTIKIENGKEQN